MADFFPMIAILVLFLVTMAIFKQRQHQRRAAITYLVCLAVWLIWLDDRWEIDGIPAKFVGYALSFFSLLPMFGVNIWRGGPLDPRMDPEPTSLTIQAAVDHDNSKTE